MEIQMYPSSFFWDIIKIIQGMKIHLKGSANFLMIVYDIIFFRYAFGLVLMMVIGKNSLKIKSG